MSSLGSGIESGTASASQIGAGVESIAGNALVSATVNTIAYGGSFGQAFENSVVSSLAAAGAGAIGTAFNGSDSSLGNANSLGYVLAHAALGCATSAAEGTGCAGGAIGGAVSATTAETIAYEVTGGQGNPDSAQLALITSLSMVAGASVAGALGQNPLAAAYAAENETLNNTCGSDNPAGCGKLLGIIGAAIGGGGAFFASLFADEITVGVNAPATSEEIAAGAQGGNKVGTFIGTAYDTYAASQNSSGGGGASGTGGGTSTANNGTGTAANDASFSVPKGYTQNADGTVTGPQGATYTPTNVTDANGNQVYQSGSGGYYTLNANGAATSPAPSTLAGQTPGSIVAANNAAHTVAVSGVSDLFQANNANVQTEVTMNTTVNGVTTTSRADMVVTAPSGTTSLPVPPGYVATDASTGNSMTSIPVNSNGQVIVEVKTGNGPVTGNQSTVYPAAQTGNATGIGANAQNAFGTPSPSGVPPTPVVILRKL